MSISQLVKVVRTNIHCDESCPEVRITEKSCGSSEVTRFCRFRMKWTKLWKPTCGWDTWVLITCYNEWSLIIFKDFFIFSLRCGTTTNWNGLQLITMGLSSYEFHPTRFGGQISSCTTSRCCTHAKKCMSQLVWDTSNLILLYCLFVLINLQDVKSNCVLFFVFSAFLKSNATFGQILPRVWIQFYI